MAVRKPAVSLADSAELRVIFSILYTIVETVRTKSEDDTEEFEEQRKAFKVELGTVFSELNRVCVNEEFCQFIFKLCRTTYSR